MENPMHQSDVQEDLDKDDHSDDTSIPGTSTLAVEKETKMMEVINNFTARVYRRVNLNIDQDAEDCGQEVEWVQEYTLKRFPKSFFDKCSIPYVLANNRDRYAAFFGEK